MSSDTQGSPPRSLAELISAYAPGAGNDRYIRFAQDVLGLTLAETQKRILRAIEEHRKVLIISGNGVGKSYGVAGAGAAFLFCNPHSTVNITSGSYSILEDTIWRPIKRMHRHAQENYGLPGRRLENPPQLLTEMDEEWFLKCVSPRHPDDLEGRHNDYLLSIVEEADKPSITSEHIDSAQSTITDDQDRMVVIANPPKNESNVVYDLQQLAEDPNSEWESIQFSSFESQNVLVDAGKLDAPPAERIPGLVSLSKLKENWKEWNGREWPGYETARTLRDPSLDPRWYRRRLGEIPPADGSVYRPVYIDNVDDAQDRWDAMTDAERANLPTIRHGIAVDIGHEGGDRTAAVQIRGNVLEVYDTQQFNTHQDNQSFIDQVMSDGPLTGYCAIDAIGEGSGPADYADAKYDSAFRFKANSSPRNETEYWDKKTEAYHLLGKFIREGGVVSDTPYMGDQAADLGEELYAAGRAMEFTERTRKSDTVLATSKSDVETHLGKSPDLLDAAAMACWAAEVDDPSDIQSQTSGMYDTRAW